jgi:hypothetical protein
MIQIKLKKVYFKNYTYAEPYHYPLKDETDTPTLGAEPIEQLCENQTMDKLEEGEQIVVSIEKIPFIMFRISLLKYAPTVATTETLLYMETQAKKYGLISISPVSLKTYNEQSYRIERWGMYDEVGHAVNKILSVVGGFINRMGKEDFNDGNYYKE